VRRYVLSPLFRSGKVSSLPGSVDLSDPSTINELRWRLPFPEEDGEDPGEYWDPSKSAILFRFTNPETANTPGTFQVWTKYGMLFNIKCYHGERFPDYGTDIKAFWNGKSSAYCLSALKFIDGKAWGVYSCIECREIWWAPLEKLVPFLGGDDQSLKERLIKWYLEEDQP